ncbi:MAG: squalene--hopene cyclase, partial [Verrucomicrobiae bacterium]|nr:squalene--hopene cyclase [Verrucomicrobiae bacterium]
LLGQQYRTTHPYTGAAPGGWAWTDLPGGVPDADDTAGALLALHPLGEPQGPPDSVLIEAVVGGIGWLLNLQNADGGIPTFCRGWGTLPFDRSAPELTAHALRAWQVWTPHLPAAWQQRIHRATDRAVRFLERSQGKEGSWIPLWFGNENTDAEINPVYGTAQVLLGLQSVGTHPLAPALKERAIRFLAAQQNPDGGWGGGMGALSTIEETALALDALAEEPETAPILERGAEWLIQSLESSGEILPSPIGLYFARLWYFERLYPLIFACGALGRMLRCPDGLRKGAGSSLPAP